MISANQIRELALIYLADADADKFVMNFAALSRNIHKNGDAESIELANKIELKMAALHSGLISPAAFKDSLREAAIGSEYVVPNVISTAASLSSFFNPGLRLEVVGSLVAPSACKQFA